MLYFSSCCVSQIYFLVAWMVPYCKLKFPNMFVQADILGFSLNAHIMLKLFLACSTIFSQYSRVNWVSNIQMPSINWALYVWIACSYIYDLWFPGGTSWWFIPKFVIFPFIAVYISLSRTWKYGLNLPFVIMCSLLLYVAIIILFGTFLPVFQG